MPKSKTSLSQQTQWTLILVGGLVVIYTGVNWQDWWPVWSTKQPPAISQTTIISAQANSLEIPSLNISAPIIYSNSTKESQIQSELHNGVVHLFGSANPGEVGNAYIIGHSSNLKNSPGEYNTVFKRLPNIQVGDEIVIWQGKKEFKYEVYATRIVEPTELWVMSQETLGEKILTLQTSYPVGTAKQRFIAIAKLK